MKTVYIETFYKDVIEGEHFWSLEEDCGYGLIEKVRTGSGWEWADGESCIVYRIEPATIVWVQKRYMDWSEYLISICCAALAVLIIAFFCYAVWKG